VDYTLCIIGLGYVGLPLAIEFSKVRPVVGFDLNSNRIDELKKGIDRTNEVSQKELTAASSIIFTSDEKQIKNCNVFIVTVPTPIDKQNNPDLSPLRGACRTVGSYLKKDDIVIFESTVFPGATREICVPILEEISGLVFNSDFFCGYSPERINPGDKLNNLRTIKKVTSGSNKDISIVVDQLYQEVVDAGTHMAESIEVAEAAKVIENTQRDVNIALINELALIFNKLQINTEHVLKAAETKWNFLPFRPGLVGGHCIGVDPYYLTYKAIEVGYNPEMILSGRRLNNFMPRHISNEVSRLMSRKRINIIDSNILILGFTFKENCPDVRNTKVSDLVEEFHNLNANVHVFDPLADEDEVFEEYGIKLINNLDSNKYDAIILAVAHKEFTDFSSNYLRSLCNEKSVIYDVKYIFDSHEVDGRL